MSLGHRTTRRGFLKSTSVTALGIAAAMAVGMNAVGSQFPDRSDGIYTQLVRANDVQIDRLGETKEDRGTFRGQNGFSPRNTAYQILKLAAAYCAPESRYRGSAVLISRMELAARLLLKAQYPDGTIDSGNLQSPPDTAFVVEPLCVALANLRRIDANQSKNLKENLERFILSAADALVSGGVHTPNHRWGER
jgi:hypothetical protein